MTSNIFSVIVFVIAGIMLFEFRSNKRLYENKPFTISITAMSFIVLNWILYMLGFYSLLEVNISQLMFLSTWFVISIIGIYATYKERNNNLFFAIAIGGISLVNLMVGIILFIIERM